MSLPSERQALQAIGNLLADWFGVPKSAIQRELARGGNEIDLIASAKGLTLVVEYKGSSDAAQVAQAVEQASRYAIGLGKKAVPVVAVAHMGKVGRTLCAHAGMSWLDLSGNAHIEAPGVLVHVEGKPNRFKRPGRPSTVFAPRSSRIVRHLLIHAGQAITQRDLSRRTGVDEGFTSRVVRKLERDGHVERDDSGAVAVADANMLLDSWAAAYDFSKHRVLKGHVVARSGEELLHRVVDCLKATKPTHAATGLGAAWLMTQFALFRLVTVYVAKPPSGRMLKELQWREEARGSNVWLVVPNDDGVFQGAADHGGVRCVHPVQVFLDLQSHPERAAEAAEELRGRHLPWSR